MNIYYDKNSLLWCQGSLQEAVTMGGDNQIIGHRKPGIDDYCFELKLENNHLGPLIGILTVRKNNGSMAGNGSLFIELQKKLISLNGISFIFTPEGVGEESIEGYTFLAESNTWLTVRVPFPDLVYNRVPFRKSEQDGKYQNFILTLKEKGIPFFNPSFIDKYELYCLLKNHPILQIHLPNTILAKRKTDLFDFLKMHNSIYLKPAQSSRGKGIYRLTLDKSAQIRLVGLTRSETYKSFHDFWKEWEYVLCEKNYLAQEEIKSALYEGKRFDFRILAHAENDGYSVTGVGIRQSQDQDITTHIPAGGRLLPYHLLKSAEHDQFIKTIVQHIGKELSEYFGYFGEFSIDASISTTGQYYLYEVNSKPMSFDETEIEERKIDQLCRLFLQLTNFQNE